MFIAQFIHKPSLTHTYTYSELPAKMKKQILSKAMWESDTNQILKEYGLRKPRIITVPRFAPSPEPVPASVLAPVPAPVFAQVPAPDCEVYDDTVCLGTTKPEIYEEEIASDQHIKIVEKSKFISLKT